MLTSRTWRMVVLVAALSASVAVGQTGGGPEPERLDAPVRVTGRLLSVNGFTEVPVGMFGVHAMPMNPAQTADWGIELFRQIAGAPSPKPTTPQARPDLAGVKVVMDCQGDRYKAPLVLTDANFAANLEKVARQYAEAAKGVTDVGLIVEFWNEPFLNWASRSDICYDVQYYDVSQAGEDKPVLIKVSGQPARHLKWRWALIGQDAKGKAHSRVSAPKGVKEGETFTFSEKAVYKPFDRSGTYTAVWGWQVYDPTQVSYWSGSQNADYYNQMLLPYAKALKAANPDLPLVAGWSFNIRANNYAAWRMLYQPTIDAAVQWMDGVNEHHYGTSARTTVADYELITGYAMANHGKWLRCYNTESNGKLDPALPAEKEPAATQPGQPSKADLFARAVGSYCYTLRDLVVLLEQCPDKAASRAAHSPTEGAWGAGGDAYAFRLLKPLRGRLVEAVSPQRSVAVVSSLNPDGALVVVMLNDSRTPRTVPIEVVAPAGTRLAGGTLSRVVFDPAAHALRHEDTPLTAAGERFAGEVLVGDRNAVRLTFPLEGRPPAGPQVERRQFFAREVLHPVRPTATLTIPVDAAVLGRATAGRLRLVVEGLPPAASQPAGDVTAHPNKVVQAAGATQPAATATPAPTATAGPTPRPARRSVTVNGVRLDLPPGDPLVEVPVDLKVLKPVNTLVFETEAGDERGYRVNVSSIVLDGPPAAP